MASAPPNRIGLGLRYAALIAFVNRFSAKRFAAEMQEHGEQAKAKRTLDRARAAFDEYPRIAFAGSIACGRDRGSAEEPAPRGQSDLRRSS